MGIIKDGTKKYPENFVNKISDLNEKEQKEAKETFEYNQWRKSITGRVWHDAIRDTIKEGKLENKKIAKEACYIVSSVWNDGGKGHYENKNYDTVVARMQKQMSVIGAAHYSNPLIQDEYISYYFRDKKGGLYNRLFSSQIVNEVMIILSARDSEKVERLRPDEIREFAKLHLPERIKLSEKTGFGQTESPFVSSFKIESLSKEDRLFRLDVPVTKKAFLNFYSSDVLHTPPEYVYKIFDFLLSMHRKNAIENFSKKRVARNTTQAQIDQRQKAMEVEINDKFSYEIEFVKSERRVGFFEDYTMKSGVKNSPNWSPMYVINAVYDENQKLGNVTSSLQCSLNRKNGAWKPAALPYEVPYLLPYPWKQAKTCRPYMNWLRCYILRTGLSPEKCATIPEQEPEMCTQ